MARHWSTYRGARRNRCIRLEHAMWGMDWYYAGHNKDAHRYEPAERVKRKQATTTGGAHEFIRRGDYAGAVKAFFASRGATGRVKASGRGD